MEAIKIKDNRGEKPGYQIWKVYTGTGLPLKIYTYKEQRNNKYVIHF